MVVDKMKVVADNAAESKVLLRALVCLKLLQFHLKRIRDIVLMLFHAKRIRAIVPR